MSKTANEALREECLKKWFCEENMDDINNRSLKQRMDIVINHVLDAVAFGADIDWTEKVAKQIRQQIGRELLYSEHMGQYANKVVTNIIREVCQLGEQE